MEQSHHAATSVLTLPLRNGCEPLVDVGHPLRRRAEFVQPGRIGALELTPAWSPERQRLGACWPARVWPSVAPSRPRSRLGIAPEFIPRRNVRLIGNDGRAAVDTPRLEIGDEQVDRFHAALVGRRNFRLELAKACDGTPSSGSSQRWRGGCRGRTGQSIYSARSTMIPSGPWT